MRPRLAWRPGGVVLRAASFFMVGTILLTIGDAVRAVPCPEGCTRFGTCNEELGRCDCPKHRTGPACATELGPEALAARCEALGYKGGGPGGMDRCLSPANHCLGACSGAGECVAGFCKCAEGKFGADCSLSLGPDGRPRLLADRGYTPRARGPRVYVYELPPEMTTWRNSVTLDRPTARLFLERLTATGTRVAEGAGADWWLLPLGLRALDGERLLEAVRYVREHHPWWNQTQGHRHMVFALGDTGRRESEKGGRTRNMTFVSHWGLWRDRPRSGWKASHRNDTDIVLPVFLPPPYLKRLGLAASRHHPRFQDRALPELRQRSGPLFWFSGRICGDGLPPLTDAPTPRCRTSKSSGYSGGTRRKVYLSHWNRTGFLMTQSDPLYGQHMLTSRYCFGPMGGGHGQRQVQAALAGCVPVLISDGVLEPFEPALDWGAFGVRLPGGERDIPRLHEVLAGIGPEEYALKLSRLRCAAQHMAFSTLLGAAMGEGGRYDAVETLLELLRSKAQHPGVPWEGLRAVDGQLDAFLDCRSGEGAEGEEAEREAEEGEGAEADGGGAGAAGDARAEGASGRREGAAGARGWGPRRRAQLPVAPPRRGHVRGRPLDLAACPRPWP
ncbi:hypothetical protein HYH03_016277 [Edaphochlamys debaryana]|uniref:EGF-like domain-containing protein n=1 Tax=Edaphochlamys debaryana TaxID=47281 RepID=A0A835XJ11_9CHLO|nr:hypothetical protein HYH03_016277 [Edaphochlamys debaryana]|eukprot:KAG2484983.1 hypothetical protein HYH03_016277 [Edaphochlamys debaryana]